MPDAFLCDAIRTPIGRLNGSLASVRADDLAALPIRALIERNSGVGWDAVDDSSPEVIRLVVLMYVRFPLSLRNVEDLLFERGIDICHETVRF